MTQRYSIWEGKNERHRRKMRIRARGRERGREIWAEPDAQVCQWAWHAFLAGSWSLSLTDRCDDTLSEDRLAWPGRWWLEEWQDGWKKWEEWKEKNKWRESGVFWVKWALKNNPGCFRVHCQIRECTWRRLWWWWWCWWGGVDEGLEKHREKTTRMGGGRGWPW